MATRTLKVQVWENAPPEVGRSGKPRGKGKLVRRFTVSGESLERMRQDALKQVDSKGRPRSASFARFAGGKGPPDGIVVSYWPEAPQAR
jgi:hypothetical protein